MTGKKEAANCIKSLMDSGFYDDEAINLYTRTLCQNITREIDRKKISARTICDATGVSPSTISRIVNQKDIASLKVDTLYKIAMALDCDPATLLPSIKEEQVNEMEIFEILTKDLDPEAKRVLLDQMAYWIKGYRDLAKRENAQ